MQRAVPDIEQHEILVQLEAADDGFARRLGAFVVAAVERLQQLGRRRWQLQLFPRGQGGGPPSLDLYLRSWDLACSSTRRNESFAADFNLGLLNQAREAVGGGLGWLLGGCWVDIAAGSTWQSGSSL